MVTDHSNGVARSGEKLSKFGSDGKFETYNIHQMGVLSSVAKMQPWLDRMCLEKDAEVRIRIYEILIASITDCHARTDTYTRQ